MSDIDPPHLPQELIDHCIDIAVEDPTHVERPRTVNKDLSNYNLVSKSFSHRARKHIFEDIKVTLYGGEDEFEKAERSLGGLAELLRWSSQTMSRTGAYLKRFEFDYANSGSPEVITPLPVDGVMNNLLRLFSVLHGDDYGISCLTLRRWNPSIPKYLFPFRDGLGSLIRSPRMTTLELDDMTGVSYYHLFDSPTTHVKIRQCPGFLWLAQAPTTPLKSLHIDSISMLDVIPNPSSFNSLEYFSVSINRETQSEQLEFLRACVTSCRETLKRLDVSWFGAFQKAATYINLRSLPRLEHLRLYSHFSKATGFQWNTMRYSNVAFEAFPTFINASGPPPAIHTLELIIAGNTDINKLATYLRSLRTDPCPGWAELDKAVVSKFSLVKNLIIELHYNDEVANQLEMLSSNVKKVFVRRVREAIPLLLPRIWEAIPSVVFRIAFSPEGHFSEVFWTSRAGQGSFLPTSSLKEWSTMHR